MNWIKNFIDQPHQLFFTSSIVFAFIVFLLTIFSLIGDTNIEFALLHGFGLIFAVFTNAFMGFLITVIPRYTISYEIESKIYVPLWIGYQIGLVFTLLNYLIVGKLIVIISLFILASIFYYNIKEGYFALNGKKESYLLAFLLIIASLGLALELVSGRSLNLLLFWSYIVSMVFIIAQKMVPSFYASSMRETPWQKPKYIIEISMLLFTLIGFSMQFELDILQKIASVLAFGFFSYIVFNLNIYKKSPPIVAILVIAFIWFWIGMLSLMIESLFSLSIPFLFSLHVIALGFIFNLFIGFGSRVIMGHAKPPRGIFTDKLTIFIFVFTQFVILVRLSSSFIPSNFMVLTLQISLYLLLFTLILWFYRYGRILLRF